MKRWLLAIAPLVALALALGSLSCGDDNGDNNKPKPTFTTPGRTATQKVEAGTLNITAKDFSFDAPASIASGLTTIHLKNGGGEDHQAQLLRLNEGVTFEQFTTALEAEETGGLSMATLAGGPNTVPSTEENEVVEDLPAGTYALVCFVFGADDVPHFVKGMISEMEVTDETSTAPQEPPTADADVTLADFSFDAPATLDAGEATIHVTNDGPQPHEMTLLKANAGVTFADIQAYLGNPAPTGPPPASSFGGLGAIAQGSEGWVKVELDDGVYVLICFVPDPADGQPHFLKGMVGSFTVGNPPTGASTPAGASP